MAVYLVTQKPKSSHEQHLVSVAAVVIADSKVNALEKALGSGNFFAGPEFCNPRAELVVGDILVRRL